MEMVLIEGMKHSVSCCPTASLRHELHYLYNLIMFVSFLRLLNSNTFTMIADDAFAGLSHLQYL